MRQSLTYRQDDARAAPARGVGCTRGRRHSTAQVAPRAPIRGRAPSKLWNLAPAISSSLSSHVRPSFRPATELAASWTTQSMPSESRGVPPALPPPSACQATCSSLSASGGADRCESLTPAVSRAPLPQYGAFCAAEVDARKRRSCPSCAEEGVNVDFYNFLCAKFRTLRAPRTAPPSVCPSCARDS